MEPLVTPLVTGTEGGYQGTRKIAVPTNEKGPFQGPWVIWVTATYFSSSRLREPSCQWSLRESRGATVDLGEPFRSRL